MEFSLPAAAWNAVELRAFRAWVLLYSPLPDRQSATASETRKTLPLKRITTHHIAVGDGMMQPLQLSSIQNLVVQRRNNRKALKSMNEAQLRMRYCQHYYVPHTTSACFTYI